IGQSVHQRSFFLLRLLVQLLAWRFQHQALPASSPEAHVPHPTSRLRVRQFYWWKSLTLPAAFRWSASTWMTILSHLSMLRSYPLVTGQSVHQRSFFLPRLLVQLLAWRFQHQVLPAPPPERYVPHPISRFRVRQFYWRKSLTLPAAFRWSVSTWMTILSHLSMLRSYPLVTEQSV